MTVEEKYKGKEDTFIGFMGDIIDVMWQMVGWIMLISAITIGNYELSYIFTWDDITDDYTCVMNNFYIDDNSSVDEAKKLNKFVETLPPAFIREFRNDWRVIIGNYAPYNNVAIGGYTNWNSRIIFIKKQTKYIDTLDIFVHELGHCLDFEYGLVSYSNFFDDIYELYKDSFNEQYTNSPDGYSTSSTTEFFAECFNEYLLYPEHLKTVAPEIYNFIDYFYKDIQKIKYMYIYDLGAVANIIFRFAYMI